MSVEPKQQHQSTHQKLIRTKPQWQEAVAGAGAGAISRTILAPIERVKLLKQLQGSFKNQNQLSSFSIAKKIYHEEGIISFWRGNLPNVIRVAGTQALNFTCMDYYKRAAVTPFIDQYIFWGPLVSSTTSKSNDSMTLQLRNLMVDHRRQIVASFISGGLAGATATTILYPIEFLRTRLAMDMGHDKNHFMRSKNSSINHNSFTKPRQYTGMIDVLIRICKSDGVFGLYQGYGVALLGGVVYRVLHLGGYDACKTEIIYRKNRALQNQNNITSTPVELTWGERFVSAQCISLLAGTITYPFDSIRRRMMMQAGMVQAERKYVNSIHCTRIIWQTEGIQGFYLGLGPNLVRSIGGALILVGYDQIKTML